MVYCLVLYGLVLFNISRRKLCRREEGCRCVCGAEAEADGVSEWWRDASTCERQSVMQSFAYLVLTLKKGRRRQENREEEEEENNKLVEVCEAENGSGHPVCGMESVDTLPQADMHICALTSIQVCLYRILIPVSFYLFLLSSFYPIRLYATLCHSSHLYLMSCPSVVKPHLSTLRPHLSLCPHLSSCHFYPPSTISHISHYISL